MSPLTEDQINIQYVDRKYELELLISHLQRQRTARAVATRKAKRLALEQEKLRIQKEEAKILRKDLTGTEKASRSPKQSLRGVVRQMP